MNTAPRSLGNGEPVLVGTDGLVAFTLQRELELQVSAGIPPGEVLAMATLGIARVMHHDQDLGSIEVGKLADLVVVEGDPTAGISAVRNVRAVVKGGTVYDIPGILAALGCR
jgi:imidazolonepropionase-like amidohydrolase